MKYLKQFAVILVFVFAGDLLHALLPLPVPANIYGMLLLLLALMSGKLPLSAVHDTGMYLIEIMPVMFIPGAVGLLDNWDILAPVFFPFVIISAVSTVIVMAAAGHVTQFVNRRAERKGK